MRAATSTLPDIASDTSISATGRKRNVRCRAKADGRATTEVFTGRALPHYSGSVLASPFPDPLVISRKVGLWRASERPSATFSQAPPHCAGRLPERASRPRSRTVRPSAVNAASPRGLRALRSLSCLPPASFSAPRTRCSPASTGPITGNSNSSRPNRRSPIRSPAGRAAATRLSFPTQEAAIAYCEAQGFDYELIPAPQRKLKLQAYADNFR
jgi:ETC complex I subunit conserved region